MLLDVWKSFEETHGTEADVAKVESMKPIVSKKRHLDEETGEQVEGLSLLCFKTRRLIAYIVLLELFTDWDFVFADDERDANPTSFKFLQMAHAWKAAQKGGTGASPSVLLGFTPATEKDADADASSEVASSHGGEESD